MQRTEHPTYSKIPVTKSSTMRRRIAIKHLGLMLGGAAVAPRFLIAGEVQTLSSEALKWGEKEPLVAALVDTIIPRTAIPGAKDLGVQHFVLKMVEDCYQDEDQRQFVQGLEQLERLANSRFGKDFPSCQRKEQHSLVHEIEGSSEGSTELLHCYNIVKHRTIQGYMNSEYVMTQQLIYEVAPARYNGYHPAT